MGRAVNGLAENLEEPSATFNVNFNAIGVDKFLVEGHFLKGYHFVPREEVHKDFGGTHSGHIGEVHIDRMLQT